jgi:DNA polymerase
MSNMHSSFLKEMGITEWIPREGVSDSADSTQPENAVVQRSESPPKAYWWFVGTKPQGDAQSLFQNMLRALGLSSKEWSWKSPSDDLSLLKQVEGGMPSVVFAFGGPAVQKITGERDPLPQLRETILALNTANEEDIPVVASFDLTQMVTKPKEKALLWQDLLLAKSVLQNS